MKKLCVIMNHLEEIRFDSVKETGTVHEKVKFTHCTFFACIFENVTWNKCHFYQTYFTGHSLYKNCRFIDCKFTGQHTNLGPATYENCIFENAVFKNNQFWTATFRNCKISGTASNVIFYGNEAPKGWETIFDRVDISELLLDPVDFKLNFDLSTTTR